MWRGLRWGRYSVSVVAVVDPVARVGAVGDIHCQNRALERALETFAQLEVDLLVSVGDLVDGEGDADRVVDLLIDRGVRTVRGNHDRWFLEGARRDVPCATTTMSQAHRDWLAALPSVQRIDTPSGLLLLGHGVADDDMQVLRPETRGYALQAALGPARRFPEVRYFLGGHTHHRMVRSVGPFVFINAGTLMPAEEPGFVVLDFVGRVASFYDLTDDGRVTPGAVVSLDPAPPQAGKAPFE